LWRQCSSRAQRDQVAFLALHPTQCQRGRTLPVWSPASGIREVLKIVTFYVCFHSIPV
jgi:hypothetical protein